MPGLTDEQQKLYCQLENAISNQVNVAEILQEVSKEDLLAALTAADTHVKTRDNAEGIVTPLGFAVVFAIYFNDQKNIKAILDAAIGQGILKKVFAGIEKGDRGKVKAILKEAGDRGMLDKTSQIEKDISDNRAEKGNSTSDESATTEQATNKAIMIGVVCGVIAGLAVGIGCGVANVGLSMLVIASIAVVAALAVGGATYMLSKPNTKVDEMKGIQVNGDMPKVTS